MRHVLKELLDEHLGMQIAPMIDCVFLLLIYFLVTSSLRPEEADLGITLPGVLSQATTLEMPDEQIVEIDAAGRIVLNNTVYGVEAGNEMPELVATLVRYRKAAAAARTKALITIQADDESLHQRAVDVMNACAAAGIKHVSFGVGGAS